MHKATNEVALRPLVMSTGRSNAAELLRQWIQAAELDAGARLPSERELGEILQVSRTTVREALSALEAQGIIDVQHGRGSFVTGRQPNSDLAAYWTEWYRRHGEELRYLLQVREALETKCALLIVERGAEPVVERLRELHEQMRTSASADDLDECVKLDVAFHRALVADSGNPIMGELLSSLESALEDDRVAVLRLSTRVDHSMRDHEAIIDALMDRTPARIVQVFHDHYGSVIADVEAAQAASRDET